MVKSINGEHSRKLSESNNFFPVKSNGIFLKHVTASNTIQYFCLKISFSPNFCDVILNIFASNITWSLVPVPLTALLFMHFNVIV